jgi:carbon-monoxide dehydrogenase small subunit
MHKIELTVDGMNRTANVEPRMLLVHVLRDELGVTAPKVGCESSRCGACTVQIDGRAVKSCTVLGVQADGAEIETAASLADDGTLDSLQSAFRRAHATQCGYCTPGLLATSDDLLSADPDPSRETIREELEGNLCRCTGYQNVVDAVETAAAAYPRSNDGEALSVAPTADENVDVSETGASGGD